MAERSFFRGSPADVAGDEWLSHDHPDTGIRTENGLDGIPKERLHEMLYQMLMGRRFEEKTAEAYAIGKIGGFCHLYIGQEAVVVGMQAAAEQGDTVITSYRDHGHMLATGMDAKGVMAELTGRKGGYSKGKGGSMHMFSREKGFYGGHGIVGGQVPLGTGLGFAHKYRADGKVCMCYLGDGAINTGAFDARYVDVRKSSAIPFANLAMMFAVAGTMSRRSIDCEKFMCAMGSGFEES